MRNINQELRQKFTLKDVNQWIKNNPSKPMIRGGIWGNQMSEFMTSGFGVIKELSRDTLGADGDTMTKSSLANKQFLMILCHKLGTGGDGADGFLRLNNDSGANYAFRTDSNGTLTTSVSQTHAGGHTLSLNDAFSVHIIAQISTNVKNIIRSVVDRNTAGAGTAPNRKKDSAKWVDIVNAVNRIDILNVAGTGSFASGSEMVILGYDPSDLHTDNFWQPLGNNILVVNGDDLDITSFAAKKYLLIRGHLIYADNVIDCGLTFNNDGGSNYAQRQSIGNAADTTNVNQAKITIDNGQANQEIFFNLFLINVAAKEKLGILQISFNSGNDQTAVPSRIEKVIKWANTADQITRIDLNNTGAGNFNSGSTVEVWGAD